MVAFKMSERRACRLIRLGRSTKRYSLRRDEQTALRIRLKELAAARPRYGYLRLHILLLREGWHINKKRVYRLYRQEGLELRHKKPKKRISALRVVAPRAKAPNECWSMDFVSDCLHDGRRFRALTIVDNVSRVSPAIEVGKVKYAIDSFCGFIWRCRYAFVAGISRKPPKAVYGTGRRPDAD